MTNKQFTQQVIGDIAAINRYDAYWTEERTQAAWDALKARNTEQPFKSQAGVDNWIKSQYGEHGMFGFGELGTLMNKYNIKAV